MSAQNGNNSSDSGSLSSREIRRRLRRIDQDFVQEGSRSVTGKDVERIVERADEIESRFSKSGPLGRVLEDGQLMLALTKDYWKGRYRAVPLWTIGAIAFALLYVLNPLDLIPDVIPVVGALDDAAVVSMCLLMVEQDLHEYKEWLLGNDE